MKTKALILIIWFLINGVSAWAGAGGDNRPMLVDDVNPIFEWRDSNYRVRFSTTIPANTATLLLGTHTFRNFTVPTGITFTTGTTTANFDNESISTNVFTTWGGRAYAAFQIVQTTDQVHVDFDNNVSSVTSPYYTKGQWVILDDPFVIQEPIYVIGRASATLTGWFWTYKPGVKD